MNDLSPGSEGSGGETAVEGPLSLTTAFELLAREPRRRLLYALSRSDDRTVSLDALVGRLDGCGIVDPDADNPDAVRTALHHGHLPKLDDAAVVEYDPGGGELRYLGDPLLDELLEWCRRREGID